MSFLFGRVVQQSTFTTVRPKFDSQRHSLWRQFYKGHNDTPKSVARTSQKVKRMQFCRTFPRLFGVLSCGAEQCSTLCIASVLYAFQPEKSREIGFFLLSGQPTSAYQYDPFKMCLHQIGGGNRNGSCCVEPQLLYHSAEETRQRRDLIAGIRVYAHKKIIRIHQMNPGRYFKKYSKEPPFNAILL